MTVNPLVIHKCMYDQRSNTASMFFCQTDPTP
jgi:hypothetical protein